MLYEPAAVREAEYGLSRHLVRRSVMSGIEGASSTGRRNTRGQLAINNDDGLPNARPNAFSESIRNQLSHNVICSAALAPPRNP
jgi:hypothetical protein